MSEPVPHPRCDASFVDRVINELLARPGRWVRLSRLMALDELPSHERCNAVRDAVETGRKLGLVISGDKRLGYRFERFERPGWTRLPGPRSWPPQVAQVVRLARR